MQLADIHSEITKLKTQVPQMMGMITSLVTRIMGQFGGMSKVTPIKKLAGSVFCHNCWGIGCYKQGSLPKSVVDIKPADIVEEFWIAPGE